MTSQRHRALAPRLAIALLAAAALAALAPLTAAYQPGEEPAQTTSEREQSDAAALMHAAELRLRMGDATGAVARALLACQLDPEIEISAALIQRAQLAPQPQPDRAAPDDGAIFDLQSSMQDLQRRVDQHDRTLRTVERDLDDDSQAEPVIQRLERELGDIERSVNSLEGELRRLRREVDRLRR